MWNYIQFQQMFKRPYVLHRTVAETASTSPLAQSSVPTGLRLLPDHRSGQKFDTRPLKRPIRSVLAVDCIKEGNKVFEKRSFIRSWRKLGLVSQ